jgi:cob(I)alamin adenosyltransferase
MGEGFTWETQDRERDIEVTRKAWEKSKQFIENPDIKMVVLDELNIALRYDYLPLEEVLETLKNRAADKHIIVTGRNAKPELIEIADLVTEMTLIKHPFKEQGIKAQPGIEF